VSQSQPNILVILADQHRPDYVGYLGDVPVRTPNLDDLADDGIGFQNAVTPSPVCGPARSCLASGLEYDRCYVRDHHSGQDFPLGVPSLYGRLRDQGGYHTIGTGKFDLQKYSGEWGIKGQKNLEANGFSAGLNTCGNHTPDTIADPYTAYLESEGLLDEYVAEQERRENSEYVYFEGSDAGSTFPSSLPKKAYHDNFIGRRSLSYLEEAPTDQPWFMQINFVNPHNPWNVTEEMHEWYRNPDVDFPEPIDPDERFDAEVHQEIRRNYAAMVENIDCWIGRFLNVLKARDERKNTIIIYSSDHGENLGNRGSWYKRSPFRESVGVPLVISGSNVVNRGVVSVPATLLDVHGTALDYAGVATPELQSRSMRTYLTGETDKQPREVVFSGLGPWRMAFDGRYKLIRGFDPNESLFEQIVEFDSYDEEAVTQALETTEPLLYDLTNDPTERENVADHHPEIVAQLDSYLEPLRS